jgi:lactoylglutathione lyase
MSKAFRTESNVQQAVPFFMVADIKESARFYSDGLGFTMTHEWVDEGRLRWCWLELGGAAVMLQEISRDGRHGAFPDGKRGMGVSIYFICRDAVSLWREFRSRGLSAGRPFVGNAMWVTGVSDPDGYELHFESPTDVAEETVWSGD